jgi:hypothetical protein
VLLTTTLLTSQAHVAAIKACKTLIHWSVAESEVRMSSLALAVSGGVLALASLLLKRASERDAELLKEMFVCLKRSCPLHSSNDLSQAKLVARKHAAAQVCCGVIWLQQRPIAVPGPRGRF